MSPQDNPISFETSRKVRMLSYALLHGIYARLLYWPQYLCYDYSMDAIPSVVEFSDCRLLLTLAGYLGVVFAIAFFMQSSLQHQRSALIALSLLLVSYLPASNILFPVGTVVGERLLYLPSAGFCLAAVLACHSYLEGPLQVALKGCYNGSRQLDQQESSIFNAERNSEVVRRGFVTVLFVSTALALLSLRTWVRVGDWESADTLFLRDGIIQPKSSKTQFNMGIIHMQNQEWDAAVDALVRCAWADPLSSLPFYRIGQIEILRGRHWSAESWLSAAIEKFGASLMVRDEEVFHDLAVAMFQNGKVESAEMRLRVSLQLNPDFAKGWNNLGCCMASQNNLNDAVRAVRKATSLEPGNPQYWANLAVLSQHTGDPATAQAAMSNALQLWPSMPEHRDCAWEFAPAS